MLGIIHHFSLSFQAFGVEDVEDADVEYPCDMQACRHNEMEVFHNGKPSHCMHEDKGGNKFLAKEDVNCIKGEVRG